MEAGEPVSVMRRDGTGDEVLMLDAGVCQQCRAPLQLAGSAGATSSPVESSCGDDWGWSGADGDRIRWWRMCSGESAAD